MSDIDFDELDRAVASVLSGSEPRKPVPPVATALAEPTKPAVAPAAIPEAAPVTEVATATPLEAPAEAVVEPAPATVLSEPVVSPVVAVIEEPTPAPMPAPEIVGSLPVQVPVAEPAKPVAVSAQELHPPITKPVQRGRFLDMIHPSHDMSPRPLAPPPVRGTAPVASQINQTFVSDVVAPVAAPVTIEPTPAAIAEPTPNVLEAPVVPAEPAPVVEAAPAATSPAEPIDFFSASPIDGEDAKPAEAVSPFISDARSLKRPLGAFNEAALPQGDELHEKLVQVESEDNIIETAEAPIPSKLEQLDAAETPAVVAMAATPILKADIPKQKAAKKVKDVTPKVPKLKTRKRNKATIIWITVGIALLLIGFGVGASLYFAVLQ